MGKKLKKKGRSPQTQKEKRLVSHSPSKVPHQPNIRLSEDKVSADVVMVPEPRRICAHLEKGFDLTQFTEKINSSDSAECEDCQEAVADRRGGAKGKGKHGKKKGADSKSDSKAIWICLKCGHYACGGVGLPTNSQCHAMRHAKQNGHPLAIQLVNTHLRWCFKCNSFIPADKSEDNDENRDAMSDVVRVIEAHASHTPSVHVKDAWFGSGSVLSEVKAAATVSSSLQGNGGYMVRGLVNLGNTCFFNSVMQNLLSLNSLRSYFFSEDSSYGPLSSSLRKLYDETRQETGMRNVINPRSFFASLCSKAPQFRGYQQHDSHELLRCLLDAWSTEELARRKQISAFEQSAVSVPNLPTFVDAAFGGQISSTVCCIECAHSSTVYEPFLDLSLPVPTKKPPTKKLQSLSRGKKTKLPPKRAGKVRQKTSKDSDRVHAESATSSSTSNEFGHETLLATPLTDNAASSSGSPTVPDFAGQTPEPEAKESGPGNLLDTHYCVQKEELGAALEQKSSSLDEFAWMDYLEPETETISNENDLAPQIDDLSIVQYSREQDLGSSGKEETPPFGPVQQIPYPEPESSSINPWEEEVPLQVQSSEVLLLPYYEESVTCGEITAGEAEASSSVVGCGQDEAAFDGFGDMFNEPEVFIGPVAAPALSNGLTPGNSSDSDPGEVDDSDSPVSVESCLAHFIKPEILSNDNAWECENCSKIIHLQEQKSKKKLGRTVLGVLNGGESESQNLDTSCSSENVTNGEAITDALCNFKDENIVSNGGETDCTSEIGMISENGPVPQCCPIQEESESQDGSSGSSLTRGVDDSISTCTGNTSAVNQETKSQSSTNVESEESEDEEKTTKKVIVKRDATKRVLIDKAPPILTIHLKRFSQDFRGRLSKLNGHVNFRDQLDLRAYMDPRCEDKERSVYRLTGVVEHLGTMRGGHYVAYIRGGGGGGGEKSGGGCVWYHVSDSYVRQTLLDEVMRCEAYILFYERV